MKFIYFVVFVVVIVLCVLVVVLVVCVDGMEVGFVLFIYGVIIFNGYCSWKFIVLVQEVLLLDELCVVFGNLVVVQVYCDGMLLFFDGVVLVKLVWKYVLLFEFELVLILGVVIMVQFMVKDFRKYVVIGGWGFGCFINGKLVDEVQYCICFVCYQVWVKDYDWVFICWVF